MNTSPMTASPRSGGAWKRRTGRTGPALSPEQLLAIIEKSGLRGRGGAGFPSGQKWRAVRRQPGDVKYVICNSDWLLLLESFPFRVIEGLALAAVAVGAHEGIFYVRHEYPLAARRVRAALAEMEKRGWLGDRLLGAGFPLRLSVVEGAGAFVCGEETGLIAALEGRRGMPRLRPPFPAESGLWGKPTLVNNAETLAAGAVDCAAWGGEVRRPRHGQKQRRQGVRADRKNSPRRIDRSADGDDAARDCRRDRRRRGGRTPHQGGANWRAVRRLRARQPAGHAGGL